MLFMKCSRTIIDQIVGNICELLRIVLYCWLRVQRDEVDEWMGKGRGAVGRDGGWVADWIVCVIQRGVGSERREVEKRIFVMKYNENDNLPYRVEYLIGKF